ncbi:MAG: SDR family oxidoreductase [Anaerolineales bacterium]
MNKPVIIITGASSGIGAATARRLARENVCLTLAARRADRLQGVASDVEKLGSEALILPTDVTKRADIHHMVQSTLDRWGRIDVLLNDAGISYDEPLVDLEPDKIRNEVQVNLIALIECTQAVLPVMLKQKSGHIINVASIEGLIATPGSSVYCATKFGVFGFSDSLRRQLRGSGIHVSAFCPGYTPSEITPRLKAVVEGRPDAPHHPGLMPTSYVADQIARLVRHPRRMVILPQNWSVLVLVAFLFPGVADALVSNFKAKRT